ncbi:MAG: PLP-dependent transferase [Acidobacteria bacterium]|nr:PLP-dependent transferase [Acidobacteriota bacterium]MCW5967369.1 PLP-dependent transferase [Blastocatellales bacterium]
MGFATKAIHAGQAPEATTGAVTIPIYQTSTYVQEALGRHKGYEYARTQNPTRAALEANLAELEGGIAAHCFASGMAAITTTMLLLGSGDHVIVSENTYGGTYRLFERVMSGFGLRFSYVDTTDVEAVRAAFTPETRMIFLEVPTNPLMAVADLEAIGRLAAETGVRLAVDNTFLSPYFLRPLEYGAHLVIHSTTKYLNGHSDSIGGAVISARADDAERLGFLQNAAGAIISPMDAWLVLRGIKTLSVRMERHEKNARCVAQFLTEHPKVRRVHYPGLPQHPQHERARDLFSGFGGMISFETGSLAAARALLDNVRLCALAESLGGVETLICHPASMTHASVPSEQRDRLGITDGLVRISVGIEDVEDIIADLDAALQKV